LPGRAFLELQITFRAAAFPGRRECSLCLFLVAWEGHQADNKAK